MLQQQNVATAKPHPDDIEKVRVEMETNARREQRMRCLELACRTIGTDDTPDGHTAAAEKYHKFITS